MNFIEYWSSIFEILYTGNYFKNLRLYHEEWRTKEVLENEGTESEDEIATFSFRGFKGDYEIKLMGSTTEIGSWTMNLNHDTEWVLTIEWFNLTRVALKTKETIR